MRRKVLVLILAALFSCAGCVTTGANKLTMSRVVESNLDFLYRNLSVEFGFCAYGYQAKEVVHITRITLPVVLQSGPKAVVFERCPSGGLLGFGHSHPISDSCNLSGYDVAQFLANEEYKYTFVVCTGPQLKLFSRNSSYELISVQLGTATEKAKGPPR